MINVFDVVRTPGGNVGRVICIINAVRYQIELPGHEVIDREYAAKELTKVKRSRRWMKNSYPNDRVDRCKKCGRYS